MGRLMRKGAQLTFCLMAASAAVCQSHSARKVVSGEEAERHWRNEQELGDLYRRIAASGTVVIGTAVREEPVSERGAAPSIDSNMGGTLYTITTQKTVCRQEDVRSTPPAAAHQESGTVYLFVPLKPFVEGVQHKEQLAIGQRYLLFLVEPSQQIQRQWTAVYQLDSTRIYYRGEEMSRGVIPLSQIVDSDAKPVLPAVLEKVTRLCDAMKPPDIKDKILGLNQLGASGDAVLRKEAEEAILGLQSPEP